MLIGVVHPNHCYIDFVPRFGSEFELWRHFRQLSSDRNDHVLQGLSHSICTTQRAISWPEDTICMRTFDINQFYRVQLVNDSLSWALKVCSTRRVANCETKCELERKGGFSSCDGGRIPASDSMQATRRVRDPPSWLGAAKCSTLP